jgi:hypothetical protein
MLYSYRCVVVPLDGYVSDARISLQDASAVICLACLAK